LLKPFFLHLIGVFHKKLYLVDTLFHEPGKYRVYDGHKQDNWFITKSILQGRHWR
jgi:hypothetical protein